MLALMLRGLENDDPVCEDDLFRCINAIFYNWLI